MANCRRGSTGGRSPRRIHQKPPMDVLADPAHVALATAELGVGDPAFGFSAPIYDFSNGQKVITGRHFDLLEVAKEKPVALVFGSYT